MFEGNLANFVRMISKEKDLDMSVVKEAIEDAIISTSQKSPLHFRDTRPELDLDTGKLRIFAQKEVASSVQDPTQEISLKAAKKINKDVEEGDLVEVEIKPSEFGRIAAQSVRQGIMQRLRDAEHDKIHNEYIAKVGNVVTGIVQRYERRNAIVNIGNVETILPQSETPYGSRYRYGDRIKVYIQDVQKTQRGPEIRVSRSCPELVLKLFEQEVPEIADGTVKIVSIAREPGVRTKIAVSSSNPDVDPVGACVGMKGSRVQMIVRELENEKIDIIPYSANPEELIKSALNPAEVVSVNLNEANRTAEVIVTQSSLSLAIGKRGQNAKLAAKLTGWKIDILSEERRELLERMQELNRRYMDDFLGQVEGLSELSREALMKSPYNSVEKLAKTSPGLLLSFTNGDLELANKLVTGSREYLEALEELAREMEKEDVPPPGEINEPAEEKTAEEAEEEEAPESDETTETEEETPDEEPELSQEAEEETEPGEEEKEPGSDEAPGEIEEETPDKGAEAGQEADEEAKPGEETEEEPDKRE